jgi:hypothetical protein
MHELFRITWLWKGGLHVLSGWLTQTKPRKGSVAPHIAGRRKGQSILEINLG